MSESLTPTFKLEVFEGPLDLLLHLISKNKVDIYDIPVAEILEQYLAYMRAAKAFNIELASEFTVMAAQLLLIKSAMLLPKYEDIEEDPRSELVQSLIEYRLFKQMRPYFEEQAEMFSGRFVKLPEPTVPLPVARYGLDPELLSAAFRGMMDRRSQLEINPEFAIETVMEKDAVSIDERIGHILTLFKTRRSVSIRSLYRMARTRRDIVVTFLAILELCRDQHVEIDEEVGSDGPDYVITISEPEPVAASGKE